MCFRFRISSPFHLDIQTMPILNLDCLRKAKKHEWIFIPAKQSEAWTVSSLHHQSKPNLIWPAPQSKNYLMDLGRCLVFQTMNFCLDYNQVICLSGKKWPSWSETLLLWPNMGKVHFCRKMYVVRMFFCLFFRKDITACQQLGYNSRNLSIKDFSCDTQDFLYGRVKAAIFSHWSRAKGKGKREAWP